jgi:hypothetical protein
VPTVAPVPSPDIQKLSTILMSIKNMDVVLNSNTNTNDVIKVLIKELNLAQTLVKANLNSLDAVTILKDKAFENFNVAQKASSAAKVVMIKANGDVKKAKTSSAKTDAQNAASLANNAAAAAANALIKANNDYESALSVFSKATDVYANSQFTLELTKSTVQMKIAMIIFDEFYSTFIKTHPISSTPPPPLQLVSYKPVTDDTSFNSFKCSVYSNIRTMIKREAFIGPIYQSQREIDIYYAFAYLFLFGMIVSNMGVEDESTLNIQLNGDIVTITKANDNVVQQIFKKMTSRMNNIINSITPTPGPNPSNNIDMDIARLNTLPPGIRNAYPTIKRVTNSVPVDFYIAQKMLDELKTANLSSLKNFGKMVLLLWYARSFLDTAFSYDTDEKNCPK